MYCVQCGAATVAGEPFCPRCGRPVANASVVPPPASAQNRVAGNLRLVAIFWFILSALRLVPGVMLFFISGSIQGILPPDVPEFVHGILQFISYVLMAAGAIGFTPRSAPIRFGYWRPPSRKRNTGRFPSPPESFREDH
jgi:hypothetical protein